MNHGYATENRVRRMQKHLIDSENISEKAFKEQHENNEKAIRDSKYNKLDKQILSLIKKGVKPPEIAHCLGLSPNFIYTRQRKIFDKNKIIKENVLEYREKRKKLFNDTRMKVKNELEDDCRSTFNRKTFFELAKAEVSYGNNLQKEDIYMLGRCIILSDKFLTKENLKLVIMQYINLGDYKEVDKYIKTLIMLYDYTEYGQALKNFSNIARKQLVQNKSMNNHTPNDGIAAGEGR